jgi:DEAD/DEAH box helicase domain-containing protein
MLNEVIFDLETKKLFGEIEGSDPADLEVSVVSLLVREVDESFNEVKSQLKSFWEEDFDGIWDVFRGADRIVGFNSINFDVPALSPYANFPLNKLPHFDILEQVKNSLGRRVSLDAIAKESLQVEKTGTGLEAVEFWRKGDKQSLEMLRKYCEQDVEITRDVYDFGLREGFLKYKDKWNTPRKIEVDFSYPEELNADKKQETLF